MLELFTNLNIEEIVFFAFSLGILFSCLFAILSKDPRNAIITFLVASIILSEVVILVSNAIVAIVLMIIYASLCSLLIFSTCSNKYSDQKLYSTRNIIFIIIFFIIAFILAYKKLHIICEQESTTRHYSGIAGISLLMALIFVTLTSGISFLLSKKH
jgi:NADH:ubiquinone oxidoreductase subunit 6 (subunit J)